MALRRLRAGMTGMGTVGAGTLRVLARNLERAASIVGDAVALTDDPMHVATHPGVDVLVEVAEGTAPRTATKGSNDPLPASGASLRGLASCLTDGLTFLPLHLESTGDPHAQLPP